MAGYSFYRAVIDDVTKAVRQVNRKIQKNGHMDALRSVVAGYPEFIETIDFQIILDEFTFLSRKESSNYCISDGFAFDAISNVRIEQGVDISLFIKESESFVLTMPENVSLSSCLVTVSDIDERLCDTTAVTKKLGIKNEHIAGDFTEKTFVTVAFRTNEVDASGMPYFYRTALPLSEFGLLAIAPNPIVKHADATFSDKLSDQEEEYTRRMMRFVARFFFYREAAPDRITKGLPKSVTMTRFLDRSTNRYSFNVPEIERTVSEHYRRATIRVLKDERFYRGQYSQMTSGSRLVLVRDTIVNKKTDNILTVEK